MSGQNNVLVGIVTGAHGLKGEVQVKTFTAEPLNVAKFGQLRLEDNQILSVVHARQARKTDIIVRFGQVVDRNGAELLRGQQLFVTKDQLPDQHDDEYLHIDLIGLKVFNDSGQEIGVLRSIQNYGAGDILDISTHDGPDMMAPFSQDAVKDIDVVGQKIIVNSCFLI